MRAATTGLMNTTTSNVPPRNLPGRLRRVAGWLARAGIGLVLLLMIAWPVAALRFDVRVPVLNLTLAVAFFLAQIAAWIFLKRRWAAVGVTAGSFLVVLAWWLTLQPSNSRDWQADVALLPYADIEGNKITIHNVRNCDYRTETDFEVRHHDMTFALDDVQTADLFLVYWGSPHIAHTMVSFGLKDGEYVCFSIETRKEKGEGYSAVRGLFRQFELTYVVADERDLVRLRTNFRKGEEVYLYRLRGTPEQARRFLLDYLERMNQLRERPQWYNAVTDNCTTALRTQRAAAQRAPWDWRLLANGHGDELLYERARIDTSLPLAELKERSHINAQARSTGDVADFSARIRAGLPGF
jgi:hypothetical protein